MKKAIKIFLIFSFFILAKTFNANAQKALVKNGIWQASIQRKDSNNIQFNFIAETVKGK